MSTISSTRCDTTFLLGLPRRPANAGQPQSREDRFLYIPAPKESRRGRQLSPVAGEDPTATTPDTRRRGVGGARAAHAHIFVGGSQQIVHRYCAASQTWVTRTAGKEGTCGSPESFCARIAPALADAVPKLLAIHQVIGAVQSHCTERQSEQCVYTTCVCVRSGLLHSAPQGQLQTGNYGPIPRSRENLYRARATPASRHGRGPAKCSPVVCDIALAPPAVAAGCFYVLVLFAETAAAVLQSFARKGATTTTSNRRKEETGKGATEGDGPVCVHGTRATAAVGEIIPNRAHRLLLPSCAETNGEAERSQVPHLGWSVAVCMARALLGWAHRYL